MDPIPVPDDFMLDGVLIEYEREDKHGWALTMETIESLGIEHRPHRVRLHQCVECGAWYLSDWRRNTCSDECHAQHIRNHSLRNTARRSKIRKEFRADRGSRCTWCGNKMERQRYSPNMPIYCSGKCRQAAYRERMRQRSGHTRHSAG